MKTWEIGGKALGRRWRCMGGFMPPPRQYLLDRSVGGFQSRSERCGEEKNLAIQEIETSLYRLSYPDS
jgi:hypothetical protein